MRIPDNDDYVSLLRANLESFRKTATACIASKEYQRAGILIPEMQNVFQEGDLILYDLKGPNKDFLPSKLTTPYKGPYVVLSQYKCSRFDSFTTYRNFTLVCISRIFIYYYV